MQGGERRTGKQECLRLKGQRTAFRALHNRPYVRLAFTFFYDNRTSPEEPDAYEWARASRTDVQGTITALGHCHLGHLYLYHSWTTFYLSKESRVSSSRRSWQRAGGKDGALKFEWNRDKRSSRSKLSLSPSKWYGGRYFLSLSLFSTMSAVVASGPYLTPSPPPSDVSSAIQISSSDPLISSNIAQSSP